jgi:hypothetical protein
MATTATPSLHFGMLSSAVVEVECIGIGLDESGCIVGRVVTAPLFAEPDDCAAAIIGLTDSKQPNRSAESAQQSILHSASWRWSRFGSRDRAPGSGCVVLTYLCVPDPAPDGPGWLVTCDPNPAAGDTITGNTIASPSIEPHLQQVLRDGIDQLAFLAEHRRELTASTQHHHPKLWETVTQVGGSRKDWRP